MITIAYINFWEDPTNDSYFTKFINYNIGEVKLVKSNDNPDILIASVFGDINNVNKCNSRCKIFYYGENLNRFPPYNNDNLLERTFDLIVGFKYTNLDKKLLRFPLWLMYYDYYTTEINNTDNTEINNTDNTDNTYNTNNIITYIESKYKENIKKNKTIFASLIARHDREGQRTKICNSLSKYESKDRSLHICEKFLNVFHFSSFNNCVFVSIFNCLVPKECIVHMYGNSFTVGNADNILFLASFVAALLNVK